MFNSVSYISYDVILIKSSVTGQVLQLYTLNYWRPILAVACLQWFISSWAYICNIKWGRAFVLIQLSCSGMLESSTFQKMQGFLILKSAIRCDSVQRSLFSHTSKEMRGNWYLNCQGLDQRILYTKLSSTSSKRLVLWNVPRFIVCVFCIRTAAQSDL